MPKWVVDNMRDCIRHGYSFDWFFNNRKEDYLTIGTELQLKEQWNKQHYILSKQF